MAFCFDNRAEKPQPYNSDLPQGSPTSPVLFLIYAQTMLEATAYIKDKDVSYLDGDGALQLSNAQTFASNASKSEWSCGSNGSFASTSHMARENQGSSTSGQCAVAKSPQTPLHNPR